MSNIWRKLFCLTLIFLCGHSVSAQLPARVGTVIDAAATLQWTGEKRRFSALAFDPSGERLAAADAGGAVEIRDLQGNLQTQIATRKRRIFEILWTPDGSQLVTLEAPMRPEDLALDDAGRTSSLALHDTKNNTIAFWNARTGALENEWAGASYVRTARFVNAKILAVADFNEKGKVVQLRALPDGKVQREIAVAADAIAPGATRFAAVIYDEHERPTLVVSTPDAHGAITKNSFVFGSLMINDVAFSSDGARVYAATNDGFKTYEFDAATLRFRHAFGQENTYTTRILTASSRVFLMRKDRSTALFDAATATELGYANGDALGAVAPDGRHLALADYSDRYNYKEAPKNTVSIVTLRDDLPLPAQIEGDKLPLPGASLVALTRRDTQLVAVALRIGADNRDADQLLSWNLATRELMPTFDLKGGFNGQSTNYEFTNYKLPLALAPNGARIAVETSEESAPATTFRYEIYNAQAELNAAPVVLQNDVSRLYRGTFSDDGTQFAAWRQQPNQGYDERNADLIFWDARGHATTLARRQLAQPVEDDYGNNAFSDPFYPPIAIAPDGQQVAASVAGVGDGNITIYDAKTGAARRITTIPFGARVRSLAWSPDGSALAIGITLGNAGGTSSAQQRVLIWDAHANRVARRLYAALAPNALRWSADGQSLVAACGLLGGNISPGSGTVRAKSAGEVRVWNVARPFIISGSTRAILPLAAPAVDVALQGQTALIAEVDERPQLWDFAG